MQFAKVVDVTRQFFREYKRVTPFRLKAELKRNKLGAVADDAIQYMLDEGLLSEEYGEPSHTPYPAKPKPQPVLVATPALWVAEVPPAGNQDADGGSEGPTAEDIAEYGDNYERDKWIFENWSKYSRAGMRDWLLDNTEKNGWEPIDKNAQRTAVTKYAALVGKPVPKSKSGPKAKKA